MVIKKYVIFFLLLFLLVFLNLALFTKSHTSDLVVVNDHNNNKVENDKNILLESKESIENNTQNEESDPFTSDLMLPDKVYTFTPQDSVETFDSVYLGKKFTYYIYIELVTPHNVSYMKITVWDPEDRKFTLFESEMFYSPEYGRYFEIPFGTSEEGEHKFEFFANVDQNFNMLIRIEQGHKCLHDKMGAQEADNLILYKVNTFDDGAYIEHDVRFETDKSYKFYIGRVSAISIDDDNEVNVDYIITDPEDLDFQIYLDELIADIDGVNIFSFGTALEGVYIIKITIRCEVVWVNIAYAIVDDFEISDAVDVTETEEEEEAKEDDVKETIEKVWDNSTALPAEWIVGTFVFIGGTMGSMTLVLVKHRKRNKVSLNIKEK